MKYCSQCGNPLADNDRFCGVCGNSTEHTEYKSTEPSKKVGEKEEHANVGLKVISFLIPIVGLILYLVWMDEHKTKAKECGKMALISVCIGVGFSLLSGILAIVFGIMASL